MEHLYNIPLLSVIPYEVPLVLSFKHLQHGQHFWTAFCTVNSLTPKISHRIVNGCDVKETIPWFAEIVIKDNPVNDTCTLKIFFFILHLLPIIITNKVMINKYKVFIKYYRSPTCRVWVNLKKKHN